MYYEVVVGGKSYFCENYDTDTTPYEAIAYHNITADHAGQQVAVKVYVFTIVDNQLKKHEFLLLVVPLPVDEKKMFELELDKVVSVLPEEFREFVKDKAKANYTLYSSAVALKYAQTLVDELKPCILAYTVDSAN